MPVQTMGIGKRRKNASPMGPLGAVASPGSLSKMSLISSAFRPIRVSTLSAMERSSNPAFVATSYAGPRRAAPNAKSSVRSSAASLANSTAASHKSCNPLDRR